MTIRSGDVFWVDDVAPLYGTEEKDRFVVVITPTADARIDTEIMVMGITSTPSLGDKTKIRLPDKSDQPQCKSGLYKPSWAIPQWRLLVDKAKLTDRRGEIRGETLRKILAAYMASPPASGPHTS